MAVQDGLLLRSRQCLMRVKDDAHEFLLHAHLSSDLVQLVHRCATTHSAVAQWCTEYACQMQVAHVAACSSTAGGL